MLRKSVKWGVIYVLEGIALLLALAIFGAGALLWRLSTGPMELDFLRTDAQTMLAQAFDGDLVALGALEARFDPNDRTIVLQARDVSVAEQTGEIVARAPMIEAGIAIDALLLGRIEPVNVTIVGGSVSVVRRADGAVGAGLGDVDRVMAAATPPQSGGDDSASLFQLLQDPAGINGPLGRLNRLSISNAAVRVVDEISGIAWLVDDAGVVLDRNEDRIRAALNGRLATVSGFAPVDIRIEAGAALNSLLLDARIENLSPTAIAPDSGPMSMLSALDAPLSLDIAVNALRDTGIRTAALDLVIGEGMIHSEGEARQFERAAVRIAFDPIAGEMTIRDGEVRSDILDADLSGRIYEIDGYVGALPTRWKYRLDMGEGELDLGGVFDRPPVWDAMITEGSVDLVTRQIVFERLDLDVAELDIRLLGEVSLSEVEEDVWLPNIRLSGPVEGDIRPETVLAYWPLELADSARDWVSHGIVSGRFYNARLDMDIRAEAIHSEMLPDDQLTLSFDFENAVVRYISTMSPIEDGVGNAVLRGNAFAVDMESGRIGDIQILEGFVDIPRLNPKGAMARYGGRAYGQGSDILALIDEPPLELATGYGVDPQAIGGEGEVTFEISRAMLTDVDPSDIPFRFEGDFINASATIPGVGVEVTDGSINLVAEQDGLEATGNAMLLGSPIEVTWREDFTLPDGEASTSFQVEASLGPRALDEFGIPARNYLDGEVQISASAVSNGLDIRTIDLDIDLTDAQLEAPGGVWIKPAGVTGSAGFTLSSDEDGDFLFEEVVAQSEGLELAASGELSREGRLIDLNLDQLHIEGFVDLQGRLAAPTEPERPFTARLSGDYLDATELPPWQQLLASEEDEGVPLSMTLDLGRLIMAEDAVYEDFSIVWRGESEGVRAFSLSGRSEDGPFYASFGAPEAGSVREFRMSAPSIGRLAALIGQSGRAVGGQLSVLGEAPPLGVDGPLTARVEVRDITLVRVPILARLLAAGSFEGLSALLNGEGISFDRIDADIMFEDDLLTIGEARAAGSSLGVTAAGTIDFNAEIAGIDGNLAPGYAVNSLFGGVPLIGDLLVSRPGEGVIGITYSVSGPFEGLTVFANPLSALAPGVLRRIFEGTAAERMARERAEALAAEAENAAAGDPETPAVDDSRNEGGEGSATAAAPDAETDSGEIEPVEDAPEAPDEAPVEAPVEAPAETSSDGDEDSR